MRWFRLVFLAVMVMLAACSDESTGPDPGTTLQPPTVDLTDPGRAVDYIVVTPARYYETLCPFLEFKEASGLSVIVADLDQIARDFAGDDPVARIRALISTALNDWPEPRPRFVLLVGNGDDVPTVATPSQFAGNPDIMETTVFLDDPYMVDIAGGDLLPDIAVGRVSGADARDIAVALAKSMQLETATAISEYRYAMISLVDSGDGHFFEQFADDLAGRFPRLSNAVRIDVRTDSPFNGSKSDLVAALDSGAVFFNFMGYASPDQWTRSGLVSEADIPALTDNDRPGIFVGWTSSQSVGIPGNPSLVEQVLAAPRGGIAASIAPVGLTWAFLIHQFGLELYDQMLQPDGTTIGEAFLAAKRERLTRRNDSRLDATERRYTLLGDPSLPVPAL